MTETMRKGFISSYSLQFIAKRSKDSNSRQGLMQRSWNSISHGLALHGLLSLLSYIIQDHQTRDVTTQGGLGPPH